MLFCTRSPLRAARCPVPLRPLLPLLAAGLFAGCQAHAPERHDELMTALEREDARLGSARAGPVELGDPHLDEDALVQAVLARNPGLDAARAGLRAALAEVRRAGELDDPQISVEVAPLSVVTRGLDFGQSIKLGQRLPLPAKLELEEAIALAEAEARRGELEEARASLALLARLFFADLYEVERALEVNAEHRALVLDLKASAEAVLASGKGFLAAPLYAESALGELDEERVRLEARRDVLRAQLNGLLHRALDAPLPPPPDVLELPAEAPPSDALVVLALAERGALAAEKARIEGAERRVERRRLDYFPDVTVGVGYNSLMATDPLSRFVIGGSARIPVQLGAVLAGVDRAEAELEAARSRQARLVDEIRVEVDAARRRVEEAREALRIFDEVLLPTARAEVEARRAAFEAGRAGFFELIEAERRLRTLTLRREHSLAELRRQYARLARAVGRTLPPFSGASS